MLEFHTFEDVLDFAILQEKAAQEFYTKLSGEVLDANVQLFYRTLAEEEHVHEKKLRELKRYEYDLNEPDLPFVFGRVNPPKSHFPFVDRVRQAQQDLNMSHAVMVDCDGLGKQGDQIHYNGLGQVELGRRFADAVIKLTGSVPPAP